MRFVKSEDALRDVRHQNLRDFQFSFVIMLCFVGTAFIRPFSFTAAQVDVHIQPVKPQGGWKCAGRTALV